MKKEIILLAGITLLLLGVFALTGCETINWAIWW